MLKQNIDYVLNAAEPLAEELKDWPGTVLASHKSAGQHYHELAFLADMGLTTHDDRISLIIQKVKTHRSEEGLFQLPNIPVHVGGTGQNRGAWALCDALLLMYSEKFHLTAPAFL